MATASRDTLLKLVARLSAHANTHTGHINYGYGQLRYTNARLMYYYTLATFRASVDPEWTLAMDASVGLVIYVHARVPYTVAKSNL